MGFNSIKEIEFGGSDSFAFEVIIADLRTAITLLELSHGWNSKVFTFEVRIRILSHKNANI